MRPIADAAVLDQLLQSVVAYFQPCQVILFGSLARGEAEGDSDIDLIVLLDDDVPDEQLSWRAAYEARRNFHRACDIIACRKSEFYRRARIVGSFPHTVINEGLVLYDRH
jgi:uncharacterized protein